MLMLNLIGGIQDDGMAEKCKIKKQSFHSAFC